MSQTRRYEPIDLSRLKTFPTQQRAHKVDVSAVAGLPEANASARELLESLPQFLGASQLCELAAAVAAAVKSDRPACVNVEIEGLPAPGGGH